MSDVTAKQIMMNWLLQCDRLRLLDFDAEYRIHSKIMDVRTSGFLPLGEEKFKASAPEIFYRLARGKLTENSNSTN
jgi:hypothetical protein